VYNLVDFTRNDPYVKDSHSSKSAICTILLFCWYFCWCFCWYFCNVTFKNSDIQGYYSQHICGDL